METKTLNEALAEFRQRIEPIKKDAANPFFKSKYADLTSILEVIKPLLHDLGLVLTHAVERADGAYHVVTRIIKIGHEDHIHSSFPLFGTKPQEFGSSITYARRYNIQALLDLPTEDDDWNSANKAQATKIFGKQARNDLVKYVENSWWAWSYDDLKALIKKQGYTVTKDWEELLMEVKDKLQLL